jgi:hypothetical protein
MATFKDIHQSVSIAELHELSSNHLLVLMELGEGKTTAKTLERVIHGLDKIYSCG